nr:PREDICTED: uncharacterized protein LOC102195664 [Pundamilia nyererei]
MTGSTCDINTSKSDTAVYWCESGSGEFSSAVNITVQNDGNGPILVSPVHPVTEGASVSLSCSLRTQKILSNVFFYHNDKLIQNDPRGELKISAVSKSDEGFYKCQYSGRESAQSWMSVKGADSSSSPVWLIVGLVCGVSLIIILLLLLYRCKRTNGPAEGDYTNVTSVIQLKVINKKRITTTTGTNYVAAAAQCSSFRNRGAERGPFGLNVPSLPRNAVESLPEVCSQHTLTVRLGTPGLSSVVPCHLIQLTTRWLSVDSSAPLFTQVVGLWEDGPLSLFRAVPGRVTRCSPSCTLPGPVLRAGPR